MSVFQHVVDLARKSNEHRVTPLKARYDEIVSACADDTPPNRPGLNPTAMAQFLHGNGFPLATFENDVVTEQKRRRRALKAKDYLTLHAANEVAITDLKTRVDTFVAGIAEEQGRLVRMVLDLALPLLAETEAFLAQRELTGRAESPYHHRSPVENALVETLQWFANLIETALVVDFPAHNFFDFDREGDKFQLERLRNRILSPRGYIACLRNHGRDADDPAQIYVIDEFSFGPPN